MNLIKQDVGVWVDFDNEKPIEPDAYWVKLKDGRESKNGAYFNGSRFETYEGQFISHWLKPIKQVYILTEDELIEFADEFIYDETRGEREQALKKLLNNQ